MAAVKGFEGRYSVFPNGDIYSHKSRKVLKPGRTSKGYMSVMLYDGSSPKKPVSVTVHSIVAEAFIGPRPDGMTINHKDFNKTNNAAFNLEYATIAENNKHARDAGRCTVPDNSKLSDDQVREIRGSSERTGLLAARYGVGPSTIRNVRKRTYYKHVSDENTAGDSR